MIAAWLSELLFRRLVRRASHRRRIVNALLVSIGLAFEVLGSVWLYREDSFRARAVATNGIVALHAPRPRLSRPGAKEVVDFTDAQGVVRRFTDRGPEIGDACACGSTVAVLYDPANPADARIDDWTRTWIPAGYFFLAGMIMLAGALLVPPDEDARDADERDVVPAGAPRS